MDRFQVHRLLLVKLWLWAENSEPSETQVKLVNLTKLASFVQPSEMGSTFSGCFLI